MEKSKICLDEKIDAINKLSLNKIKEFARENEEKVSTQLTKLFKDQDCLITEENILDLVGTIFLIESLILSEKMRDKRLTDLDQNGVENLAMELYLSIEQKRSSGHGYTEMGVVANNIIDEHLSKDQKGIQ